MSTMPSEEQHLAEKSAPRLMESLSLFDLSWDDILIPYILSPYLSLKDLFNIRITSQNGKRLVECAFEKLKEINMCGNNSQGVEAMFSVLVEHCRRLNSIYLANCHWLTDELLLPILAKNSKRLQVVNLNECVNITPLALQHIIIECKNLKVLKLSKCQWLTTGAMDALTLHQSNLEEFDISYCSAIGERCLTTFLRKLNKLTVLSLANTPSVTDQVLIQIGQYCQALEHINLIGCTAITDYGIQALTKNCKVLQSLMIRRCGLVTERSLAPLRGRIHIDKPRGDASDPSQLQLLPYNFTEQINHLYLPV